MTAIGGFLAAVGGGIQLNNSGSGDDVIVFVAATWGGTLVTAGFLAFCGYVLEILVEVYEQVFHVRHELAEAADLKRSKAVLAGTLDPTVRRRGPSLLNQ